MGGDGGGGGGLKASTEEELPRTKELCTGKSLPPTVTADRKQEAAAEMAAQAQQPPHLHLAELTATQFIDIWKHFDADGECGACGASTNICGSSA